MDWRAIRTKFDRFDQVIVLSIGALFVAVGFYASANNETGLPDPAATRSGSGSVSSMFSEMAESRAMVDKGRNTQAIEKLRAFDQDHPGIAETHLLLARAYAAVEQYPAAIKQYRATLMLDPEYADKTSAKFIGKGIKSVMQHGWAPCEITLNPTKDSPEQKAVLEDARYIQRMLAGGCE